MASFRISSVRCSYNQTDVYRSFEIPVPDNRISTPARVSIGAKIAHALIDNGTRAHAGRGEFGAAVRMRK